MEGRVPGLTAGEAAFATGEKDDRDLEIPRLRAKLGEVLIDNELLESKIDALEGACPLAPQEVETISARTSPSNRRPYGISRVARPRWIGGASVYRHRTASDGPRRPGPEGAMSDAALVAEIRSGPATSPFHGEG